MSRPASPKCRCSANPNPSPNPSTNPSPNPNPNRNPNPNPTPNQVPLLCNKSGDMTVVMFDGGFTTMSPAPPLTLAFFGGPAVAVAFVVAEKDVADVEKGILVEREVSVHVQLVDMHENVSPEFDEATVEVRPYSLLATHHTPHTTHSTKHPRPLCTGCIRSMQAKQTNVNNTTQQ